jgi:hypothetical protein
VHFLTKRGRFKLMLLTKYARRHDADQIHGSAAKNLNPMVAL